MAKATAARLRELGRLGGLATKRKHQRADPDYYSRIARIGGLASKGVPKTRRARVVAPARPIAKQYDGLDAVVAELDAC